MEIACLVQNCILSKLAAKEESFLGNAFTFQQFTSLDIGFEVESGEDEAKGVVRGAWVASEQNLDFNLVADGLLQCFEHGKE